MSDKAVGDGTGGRRRDRRKATGKATEGDGRTGDGTCNARTSPGPYERQEGDKSDKDMQCAAVAAQQGGSLVEAKKKTAKVELSTPR
jgi:hypothetical protein